VRTTHIEQMQDTWQQAGNVTNATINKRCATLRRAFALAVLAGDLPIRPAIPMLTHQGIQGKYLDGAHRVALAEHLPDHLARFFEFACEYGTRKGQLAVVERTWVDHDRRVITWPPSTTKRRRTHQLPLGDRAWMIVAQLLAEGETRPWCKYLFHGASCHAGRPASQRYGCIGDFKNAWKTACKKAGLPVGRKAGGPIFHDTRNTAVTDLLAGDVPIDKAMAISGHETTSMIKHYDLGNVEALRASFTRSRAVLADLKSERG
jgi:integrase